MGERKGGVHGRGLLLLGGMAVSKGRLGEDGGKVGVGFVKPDDSSFDENRRGTLGFGQLTYHSVYHRLLQSSLCHAASFSSC